MVRCLSVVQFADYLSGDETHRPHVAGCARCRSIASALGTVNETPDIDSAITEIVYRQLNAQVAVAELEARLPHLWESLAAADHRLHGPEGVRRLLQRAGESLPVTPRRSLTFVEAAVACCASERVSASLRFEALKVLGTTLLVAADDLSGAIDALRSAETVIPLTDDPVLSEAVLHHVRAYVYGHPSCAQWDEALRQLDLCEPAFAERYHDHSRGARHLRAAILLRRSDYSDAAALYQGLLANETDPLVRAHLTKDLAVCLCRMGRAAEALPLATEALNVFLAAGHADTIARGMWARGQALAGVGEYEEAIGTLEKVSRVFAATGQNDDELAAELDTIDAILAGNPAADIANRLEDAYLLACGLDNGQPLRSGARRAALWDSLRVAYAKRALTSDVIAHASEYLRTLGRGDEAPFVPPLM